MHPLWEHIPPPQKLIITYILPIFEVCCLQSEGRIVGGKDAELGQFPWLVNLGYTQVVTNTVSNKHYLKYLLSLTALVCKNAQYEE